jgi:3D (Asp-Asp-Asp) domain-containing protein
MELEVTGYCPCGSCCGWRRDWLGRPVYAYGPMKGQRKQVGVTASGSRAAPGTIAADTALFPFGTIMRVPGYGYGRVEDRGGAIKGGKIDLYYHDHNDALQWGRQRIVVDVWLPSGDERAALRRR